MVFIPFIFKNTKIVVDTSDIIMENLSINRRRDYFPILALIFSKYSNRLFFNLGIHPIKKKRGEMVKLVFNFYSKIHVLQLQLPLLHLRQLLLVLLILDDNHPQQKSLLLMILVVWL